MKDRSAGPITHPTAQTKFALSLLLALLILLVGCFPWVDGEYEFQLADIVKVVHTGTNGLLVRSSPGGAVGGGAPNHWVFQIAKGTPEPAILNGTSHLWWYVTDAQYEPSPTNGWVAEEYLTKVLSHDLSPNAVPSYFALATAQIGSVVERALQEVQNESEWYDYQEDIWLCLGFVRAVYAGESLGWISANAAMQALERRGLFHSASETWNPPKGALVFFESNLNPDYDHVGLYIGSRQVAHVEGDRKAHVRDLKYVVQRSYIDAYAGWAYPPEEWLDVPAAQKQIAFLSKRDGNWEIYVMNADGSKQRCLTNNPAVDTYHSWSPDGEKIAFASDRDGNSEIYVMNADGSNQRRLTYNAFYDYRPRWSPDGKKILFESLCGDHLAAYDICVINVDGTNERNLTNSPTVLDALPQWRPDGKKILFLSTEDGDSDLYDMNPDGTGKRNLTNDSTNDMTGVYSPDSTKIAYEEGRDGNYEIYVMNADGTNQKRLTANPERDVICGWVPNSNKIAFGVSRAGHSDVYTMNADGSAKQFLITIPEMDITWSADGERVAFALDRDGNYEIYVMNADGTNLHRLTNNPESDTFPIWSPGRF
ncbi:PD40 domain-containing protein [Candidatus Bipolaricaulota bacterium]|nr:PD40 domain-containing protein [Candidatus Bipolaricaulota bacterium]